MQKYLMGRAAIITNAHGNEVCRITPESSTEPTFEGDTAVTKVLQAVDSFPQLMGMLNKLVMSVEKATTSASPDNQQELQLTVQAARSVLDVCGARAVLDLTLLVRSDTTGGRDSLAIQVHPGQSISEVVERVASSHGAYVERISFSEQATFSV